MVEWVRLDGSGLNLVAPSYGVEHMMDVWNTDGLPGTRVVGAFALSWGDREVVHFCSFMPRGGHAVSLAR